MTLNSIITLLATGIGTGFACGLLGVGGGFIMTPIQYSVFTGIGVPPDIAIKLAFGTSLMVILPTAASGALRHHKKGAVWWKAALIMGGCGLATAFGGATLASQLSAAVLKPIFGAVVLAAGTAMLFRRPAESNDEVRRNPWLWVAVAAPIGLVSGLTGLGGGVLAVPAMVLLLRFKMHDTIATSLAFIMFTSIGGIIGYIINGLGVPGLPAHSLGYVQLDAAALLIGTSIPMAQIGARVAHRLPAQKLRYIFISVMFYMGLRILGVFG